MDIEMGAAGAVGVRVREVMPADVPALERALPGDHAQQLANAAAGRRTFLVAWSGEKPVGTAVVRWTGLPVDGHGPAAEIGSLEIVAARRGEGIGSLLVAAAEQRVLARGGTAAAIVVAEDNRDARRLYERLGYQATGARRAVVGGAGLLLVRALGGGELSGRPRAPARSAPARSGTAGAR